MDKKIYIIGGVFITIVVVVAAVVIAMFFSSCKDASTVPDYPPGPKLIIDHDGGADDSMAIFIALLYEKYFNGPRVIGLTTVHGNVNETQAFENSQRILDVAERREVPIYRGSKKALVISVPSDDYFGSDGLGDLENVTYEAIDAANLQAAVALVELSKKYPGEVTVIAIGPLTNIAIAITLDPCFIERLSQLSVGAGTIYSNVVSEPEFNAEMDVEAYHIVAENAKPEIVTVMPFSQVKLSLNISLDWRISVLGAIPTKIMEAQNRYESISISKSSSWFILDPAVVAATLDKNVVNVFRNSENSIILCGEQRGINTNNFTSSTWNTRLTYSYDIDYYKDLLLRVFSAELQ